jgi:hypothetical protein
MQVGPARTEITDLKWSQFSIEKQYARHLGSLGRCSIVRVVVLSRTDLEAVCPQTRQTKIELRENQT